MIYRVTHQTIYYYNEFVTLCHNSAHLRPRQTERQRVDDWKLNILPNPTSEHEQLDYFGNWVTFFSLQEHHRQLEVHATSRIEVHSGILPVSSNTPPWEHTRDMLRRPATPDAVEACQFTFESPHVPVDRRLLDYAKPSFLPNRPVLEAIIDLNSRIHREFQFDPTSTDVSTSPLQVLDIRRGVCQDFAHLMVGCLRSLGLAARYVSGYLRTVPPPGQPRLEGADASHAWVSAWIPGAGWIDFDPTNNQIPTDEHLTLGWGRDFSDVTPLKGVILGGGQQAITVSVDVLPLT